MLGAIRLDWSLAANLAALLGGLAILLGAAMAINRYRGRPLASLPEDVGRIELAAFVLVPALLPLIFGGQTRSAWVTALANLALVLLIYAVFGYGLVSIVRWVGRRLWHQLLASFMLLARAVPLLMIFALLAFMSTEMWQVFSAITDADLVAIALLFVGLGTAFLLARLPREVRALEAEVGDASEPLKRKQRRNVGARPVHEPGGPGADGEPARRRVLRRLRPDRRAGQHPRVVDRPGPRRLSSSTLEIGSASRSR